MLDFLKQTRAEKRANIAGLNLFFGALLGANLGTATDLPPREYLSLILQLVAAVVAVQIVSASTRRAYMVSTIAVVGAVLAFSYFDPRFQPDGMSARQYGNVLLTLGIWLVMVVGIEVTPLTKTQSDI